MEKVEILKIFDKIENLISNYTNNYKDILETEKDINNFYEENKPNLPRRFVPTEQEKFELSPKQIKEKDEIIQETYKNEQKKALLKLEEYKNKIGYIDYSSEVLSLYDTLPIPFKEALYELDSGSYIFDTFNKIETIIDLSKKLLNNDY